MPVKEILEKYPLSKRENLIPILQEVQNELGYLSEEAVVKIGDHLQIPASKIYSVSTFYKQFRFVVKGQYHIRVCNGTACYLSANADFIKTISEKLNVVDGATSKDGRFSLEVMACIGACGHAPVVEVNGKYYPGITKEKLNKLLDELMNEE